MNGLVDRSVWVGHFKQKNPPLVTFLGAGRAVCHPNLVLEVACGTPPHCNIIMLWTFDKRLDQLAIELNIAYRQPLHS